MKKVVINESLFKTLMNGVKHCISNDNARPGLEYIKINVEKDKIIAYASDGYRAARVEMKINYPIDEEFSCLIKPISFKVSKKGINTVTVEKKDDGSSVEIQTEYGMLKYEFKAPEAEFFDIEKVYTANRPHDSEVALQSRYVKDAVIALKGIQNIQNGCVCVFESKANPASPIIIKAENSFIKNEQLILPVRSWKNN